MNDPTILADFTGTARLFPLPNLVLFPQVVQGLHIFEPRYRQLMADALADDRLITLVLLKPGWEEEYDEAPAIEPVACLGRVTWHEKLPDGRYNLRLRGAGPRADHRRDSDDRLYRTAHAEVIPESGSDGPWHSRRTPPRAGGSGAAAVRGRPGPPATPGAVRRRDAARAGVRRTGIRSATADRAEANAPRGSPRGPPRSGDGRCSPQLREPRRPALPADVQPELVASGQWRIGQCKPLPSTLLRPLTTSGGSSWLAPSRSRATRSTSPGPQLKPGDKAPDFQALKGLDKVTLARHAREGAAVQRRAVARHRRVQHADQEVRRRGQGAGRHGRELHGEPRSAVRAEAVLHAEKITTHDRPSRTRTTTRSARTGAC